MKMGGIEYAMISLLLLQNKNYKAIINRISRKVNYLF